jgi:glycosyltransferase involved in cell wall biosynthesis
MKISFIQPSRNNLKYLKWSYDAIRKNQGNHEAEICIADDFSNDGTWEWCQEMMDKDPHFKAIRNEGPTRLGHTILYDKLVNEVASHDVCMIYHADMYLCPNALDEISKYIAPKTIVSLTRIEPSLHPDGPEKILADFGIETEQFDENKFLKWFENDLKPKHYQPTEGVFAPWAFIKSDFQEIGGHDPLYAPQSKEDSDIFNRFQLNGVKFLQTWEGCVYHMTCRGSRFNPTLTTPGKNSSEWEEQNLRSTRNFIRKWGHFCKHDALMKPIIPPKYNIAFVIENCSLHVLESLEPWCDRIYTDEVYTVGRMWDYIENEQQNTKFDLRKRVLVTQHNDPKGENDIIVSFDASKLTHQNSNIITHLSEIIKDSGEIGTFVLDIFTIDIIRMNEYQNDLIKL